MAKLLKAISSTDTTISVALDAPFPELNAVIKIGSEMIGYTNNYAGTLYACTRGVNGTSAASHSLGDAVTVIDYNWAIPTPPFYTSVIEHDNGVSPISSNAWFDVTHLDLPAGDWRVVVQGGISLESNGDTFNNCQVALGLHPGNDATGLVKGDNVSQGFTVDNIAVDTTITVPFYRLYSATAFTVYYKANIVYTSGALKAYGRLSATGNFQ